MYYRALLAAVTLTVVCAAGAQAQAKAPTTTVSHPVIDPNVAKTKAPTAILGATPSNPTTQALLPTGNYTLSLTFTNVNGASEARHASATVHLTHTGSTVTIGSTQTALSGSASGTHLSMSGSRADIHVGHVTLTLNGTETSSGAAGTVTAVTPNQTASGTFTLTPTPLATAHMVKVGSFSCDDHCEEIILAAIAILAL